MAGFYSVSGAASSAGGLPLPRHLKVLHFRRTNDLKYWDLYPCLINIHAIHAHIKVGLTIIYGWLYAHYARFWVLHIKVPESCSDLWLNLQV